MKHIRWHSIRTSLTPYLLTLPAILLLCFFLYGVINGILQGFGIMPFLHQYDFTLEHYERVITSPSFLSSLGFSLLIAGVSAVLATVLGVALAAALTTLRASRGVQLFSLQVPIITMHALVALAVMFLFSGSGLFPRILHAWDLVSDASSFASVVGAPSGWGIILVYLWKETPFVAFMTLTLMLTISKRYGQAAQNLGASPVRSFFSVTLPLCKNSILKAFLIIFAFAFGAYEVPFLLGPTAPKPLPVLAYFEFQNPDLLNRSYAMAINGTMTIICVGLAFCYFILWIRERKQQRHENA